MENLPVVIAFFQMQTALLYLPAWLLSSAFDSCFLYFVQIYSCYVQEDYQKPEAHSISLSLLVSHGLFLLLLYYLSLFLLGPRAALLVPKVSQSFLKHPTGLIFRVPGAQIQFKGPERG